MTDATGNTMTLNAVRLNILQASGAPFATLSHSTMNEGFGVGLTTPVENEYPVVKYMAVGIGGLRYIDDGDGGVPETLIHSPDHQMLFKSVPYRLVPTTNDLTAVERAKYRIRRLETYNAVDYFAYYLKAVEISTEDPESRIIELENGIVITDVPFIPDTTSLTPTPVDPSNVVENTTEGRHLVTSSPMSVSMDAADIEGIVSAVEIIYGNRNKAVLSETAIVSGFDYERTTTDGGVSATYTEVRSAQALYFTYPNIPLYSSTESFVLGHDLGDSMSLPPALIT